MIKWQSNFQIEDATVQLAEAYIRVIEFKNVNDRCHVSFRIGDINDEITVKEYTKTYNRNFTNVDEIYEVAVTEYDPSEIV